MITAIKPRPRREDLGPDEVLCDHCTARCCRYFALPIDTPTSYEDYQYIRWYLLHGQATVFVDDDVWYLMVHTDCKHLGADNRCGIYETRPQICRDYTTDNCEYEDDWVYDQYFETPEQVEEYMEAMLAPKRSRRGKSIRGRKPELLPIIG
jgi:Fe-S-cluster containining protein